MDQAKSKLVKTTITDDKAGKHSRSTTTSTTGTDTAAVTVAATTATATTATGAGGHSSPADGDSHASSLARLTASGTAAAGEGTQQRNSQSSEKRTPRPPNPTRTIARPPTPTFALTNPLALPTPLTTKQLVYLWLPQTIGAAILDGGINFGIACAMYRGQDNVTVWDIRHNTIAGDCGVTVFIQGILSFVIASSLVHLDMRKGTIIPFSRPWPDTTLSPNELFPIQDPPSSRPHGALYRAFLQRPSLRRSLRIFQGSDSNDLFARGLSAKVWFKRLRRTVWQGAVLSALFFLLWWPITIAVIAPIWGGRNMAHTWVPQIIKLVFAFVLGFFQNPIIACIALGAEDSVRTHEQQAHEEHVRQVEKAANPSQTTEAERYRAALSYYPQR
ncbi:BQ2448_3272 [Microbotryum intermedium]|uniref:BQ2448_3272 protein n=1 Tax=Microbotryum intermedium TaxID=269621 RepID=A0A238FII4_9BASI|nr:BQ2448_3272 [Microbotryum intermedium]